MKRTCEVVQRQGLGDVQRLNRFKPSAPQEQKVTEALQKSLQALKSDQFLSRLVLMTVVIQLEWVQTFRSNSTLSPDMPMRHTSWHQRQTPSCFCPGCVERGSIENSQCRAETWHEELPRIQYHLIILYHFHFRLILLFDIFWYLILVFNEDVLSWQVWPIKCCKFL